MPNPIAGIVGGGIVSGLLGSSAAKSGAKSAAAAEQAGIDFQRESRDLSLGYQKPYRDAGYNALSALMDMSGLTRPAPGATSDKPAVTETYTPGRTIGLPGGAQIRTGGRKTTQPVGGGAPSDVPDMGSFAKYDWQKNDPGYAFRLEEGQRATENLLRGAGLLNSGKALRSIQRYGQDYASNEYDKAWSRLASIAGYGGNAVNSGNASIGNAANSIQQGYSNIGDANAYGKIGAANAWSGVIDTAVGAYGKFGTPATGSSEAIWV